MNKVNIFVFILMSFAFLSGSVRSQTAWQGILHGIQRNYFDSSTQLYKEKLRPSADDRPFAYLWPICALFEASDQLARTSANDALFLQQHQLLRKYFNPKVKPFGGFDSYLVSFGGDSRFYDDNQWLGITYIHAFERSKDSAYFQLALQVYRFMMTGFDTLSGGGIYWKEHDFSTKNTCSNGPGVVLALDLYKVTGDRAFLDTALAIFQWVNLRLKDASGLYWDNINMTSGKVDSAIYTYNTGTMLESYVKLFQITGNQQYLEEAKRIANRSITFFLVKGELPDNQWFNAVWLRGLEALYHVDQNPNLIRKFEQGVKKLWAKRDALCLVGKDKILLDQAGFLEVVLRLERLNRKNKFLVMASEQLAH